MPTNKVSYPKTRPKRKAIVARYGKAAATDPDRRRARKNARSDRARAELGYRPCPRCGKHMKDLTRSHYVDQRNKIHCLPPFDELETEF